jgi:hypothetical protein
MLRPVPLVLLVSALCPAQDVNAILKRFLEAEGRNGEKAGRYTYVEHADYFNFDKNGRANKVLSETHEIVFVEGGPYRKLVERNERPLGPREQAREDKRLQAFAALRRKNAHSGVFHRTFNLGSDDDLLTLFDNRLAGEEEVRGRKARVLECTPKAGLKPADTREKQATNFRRKLWIDEEDYTLARSVYTVVGPDVGTTAGTTYSREFEKIGGDVWMQTSWVIDGHLQFAKLIKPKVRTEYTDSKFRKFDVQSTVTVDAGE